MPPAGPDWPSLTDIPASDYVLSLHDHDGFSPDDWRDAFLDRFADLNFVEEV